VAVGYSQREPLLQHLNFAIGQGEFLGIIGPNGSGKSTLLKTLLGLISPLAGERILNKEAVRFGYVPQRHVVDEIFPLTVEEVVMMGRYGWIGPARRPRPQDHEQVTKALHTVGMHHLAQEPFRELSGGQKQRALLARALASEATVLVLDEPTNDLDVQGELQVMELLKQLHREEKKTILVVSHLLNTVLNYVEKIGFTVGNVPFSFQAIEETVTEEHLSQLYGVRMKLGQLDGRWVVVPYGIDEAHF